MSRRRRAAYVLDASGMSLLIRSLHLWRGLLVLNYHRIGDRLPLGFDHALRSATPEAFDAQLIFLKQHFDIIKPSDIATVRRRKAGRYLLLTLDDGYLDNYEQAFQILRAHGVAATFFVCTSFLDGRAPAWWDEIAWMVRASPRRSISAGAWLPSPLPFDEPERVRAVRQLLARYKELPGEHTHDFLSFLAHATESGRLPPETSDTWMTWDMVREMRAAGMCFGGHTVHHPVLARLPREEQAIEIAGCKQRLEAELGEPMTLFAYPVGSRDSFNDDTRACLRAQGVDLAFSFYGGYRAFDDWDPYDVRRSHIGWQTSLPLFHAMVALPQLFAPPERRRVPS